MTGFDSTALAAFHDVWVFCEQRDGVLSPTALELLAEGRRLADERKADLCGLLLGHGVAPLAAELGGHGADKVYLCEHPLLKTYTTDAYASVTCQMIEAFKPEIFLVGATMLGRDLAPRCAARLHTGLCADCTHLDIDMDRYKGYLRAASSLDVDAMDLDMSDMTLKMTRPAFGGHLMATIICPRTRPCMATVRPGVMKKAAYDAAKAAACTVVRPAFSLQAADLRVEVTEIVHTAREPVDLTGAEYIVAVGRGIGKDVERGIQLAEALAAELGGVVGGSRAVVDAGWLDADRQIGQTGKTVRPKVYIALGISGAIQHRAGMQDSGCIIAINKNEAAPIFEVADYGICGDLFTVVPRLLKAIHAVRTATGEPGVEDRQPTNVAGKGS